jgi:ribonuclease HI
MADSKRVSLYTDGSSLGNPGPGGWAAILRWNGHEKVISGGFSTTTNNRMEILAVVEGLALLKRRCSVDVYTDSRYVRDAVEKGWLAGWQRKGWKTAGKKSVKNQDLWLRLIPLLQTHDVRLHWVAGHSGHPENERCDELAKAAAMAADLPEDTGYTP